MPRKYLPKKPPPKPTLAMKKKAALDNLSLIGDLLRRYGWIQGELGSVDEGFCLYGAVQEANGWGETLAWRALRDVVRHDSKAGTIYSDKPVKTPVYFESPIEFNDELGTKKRHITRLLKRTASLIAASKKATRGRFELALDKS